MKNKKLLAMLLLPIGLAQTVSAWWTTSETKTIITKLLTFEKVSDTRRPHQRYAINHYILKDEF